MWIDKEEHGGFSVLSSSYIDRSVRFPVRFMNRQVLYLLSSYMGRVSQLMSASMDIGQVSFLFSYA